MALCDLCKGIPFDDLPSFPNTQSRYRIADKTSLPCFWEEKDDVQPDTPLGFRWHESLHVLAEFAKLGCPLCVLAQAGAKAWLDTYHKAEETDAFFVEFHRKHEPVPDGQVLWISKRVEGGDGLAILVRKPGSPRNFMLLTSVGFCVSADHPLARQLLLRPVEQYSGSSCSLDVAASWVERCIKDHERCAHDDDALLPSRILDVGSAGDLIKLIEPETGSTGTYVSLSHCWGSSIPLTTTRESRQARMSGISIADLPKTFRDAAIMTRRLGIQYLWIDSLCIYQDDRADWARESARMTEIYSNAYVVIAASHAANSSEGCFHTRPHRPSSTVSIPGLGEIHAQLVYNENESPWRLTNFEGEPLADRGWALQESSLAARVLYYTTTQMYFECDQGRWSEDGYFCPPDIGNRPLRFPPKQTRNINEDRELWDTLISEYGQRKLTKATDKLPAMSGLAKKFGSRFGALYVAGLWSDALVEGLTWQCIGTRAPMSTTEYVGPSWSWASYGGIASTRWDDERHEKVARVDDWYCELQDEENPYGAVKSAWMSVHGPLAQLEPSDNSDLSEAEKERRARAGVSQPQSVRITFPDAGDETIFVHLDHEDTDVSEEWRQSDLRLLILAQLKESRDEVSQNDGNSHYYYGLVVRSVRKNDFSQWKRIGWLWWDGKEADNLVQDKGSWRTITLI